MDHVITVGDVLGFVGVVAAIVIVILVIGVYQFSQGRDFWGRY